MALPTELGDFSALLAQWSLAASSAESDAPLQHPVHEAVWATAGDTSSDPAPAGYAQVAYKTQLLPLLGDAQAKDLPGATGALARQNWRVQWHNQLLAVDHPALTHFSSGHLEMATAPAATAAQSTPT